jgi:CHAD domain-containing protein
MGHISKMEEDDRRAFMPLYDIWEQERASHMAALREHIASNQYTSFQQKMTDFLATPGVGDADDPVNASGIPLRAGALAPLLILRRYSDILAFGPYLSTATLDLLHGVRIHCKKLRYALEFFRDLLGEETPALMQRIVAMQDLLGEIQDAQTAGQLITTFVDSLERRQLDVTFTERINPAPLLHYLAMRQAEKHRLLASVEPAWDQLTDLEFRELLLRALLHTGGETDSAS